MCEDDHDEMPEYYVCLICGHIQDYDGECNTCAGLSMSPVY